jgi:hypothetical protein
MFSKRFSLPFRLRKLCGHIVIKVVTKKYVFENDPCLNFLQMGKYL